MGRGRESLAAHSLSGRRSAIYLTSNTIEPKQQLLHALVDYSIRSIALILHYRSNELQISSALQLLCVAFTESPRSAGEFAVSPSAHAPSKQLRVSTLFTIVGCASRSYRSLLLSGVEQAPKEGSPLF
jgi:hypothetical protein